MTEGWIYGFSNSAMPGLTKIGEVHEPDRIPEDRAEELYTTPVPARFKVEFAAKVSNSKKTEREIHTLLANLRFNNSREFFTISPEEAKLRISAAFPDIVWRSEDQVYEAKPKSKSTTLQQRLNKVKIEVEEFVEYMKENKYFDDAYEYTNECNCNLMLDRIHTLQNGLDRREEFQRKHPDQSKKDDKWVKDDIKDLSNWMERLKTKVSYKVH
jgi:hypothetical protein